MHSKISVNSHEYINKKETASCETVSNINKYNLQGSLFRRYK